MSECHYKIATDFFQLIWYNLILIDNNDKK